MWAGSYSRGTKSTEVSEPDCGSLRERADIYCLHAAIHLPGFASFLLPTLLSFLLPFFISSLLPLIFSFIPSSSTFLYCVLLCFSDFSYSLTSPLLPAILPPPFTQPLRPSFVLFNFISFNPPLRSSLILLINLFSNFLRVVHEADQFSLNPADVQCINTSVCFTQSACQLDETTSLHSVLHQDWGS